jgi:hypothetical protein
MAARRSDVTPPTPMAWAILSTVLFWPLGVVAIMHAARVSKRWAAGDRPGAVRASDLAKVWAAFAIGCGVLWWGVVLLLTN